MASLTTEKADPFDSPIYLLAVLFSARKSGDTVLERLAGRRLADLGISVQFAADLPRPGGVKGVARG
jgi:hypothetical protein